MRLAIALPCAFVVSVCGSTTFGQTPTLGSVFQDCDKCPLMVVVPAGSFTMGSPASEPRRDTYEGPQHKVTFAKPFAVAKYELTFAEWDACVTGGGCSGYEPNDLGWGRGQHPVINVSWDDAQAYVAWLSEVTGKTYRLLSEAEYEYATRAGTTTIYAWGDDIGKNNANCNGCGSKWDVQQTAPVGSFPPNKFGLYDMVGNVFEWTQDCYHDDYQDAPTDGSAWITGGDCSNRERLALKSLIRRAVRGGSWSVNTVFLRSAFRVGVPNVIRGNSLGFRVGRALTP